MSSKRQVKVPAEEFARRYGWRTSAVVHRIRAGIYDGVEEEGRWYVLRAVPDSDSRGSVERDTAPSSTPELPWSTVPFPLPWVLWALFAGVGLLVPILWVNGRQEQDVFLGAGMFVIFGSMAYEALRTGTVRLNHGGPVTLRSEPIFYTFQTAFYCLFAAGGAVATIVGLIRL